MKPSFYTHYDIFLDKKVRCFYSVEHMNAMTESLVDQQIALISLVLETELEISKELADAMAEENLKDYFRADVCKN